MGQRIDPTVLAQYLDAVVQQLEGIIELPDLLGFRVEVAQSYVKAKAQGGKGPRTQVAALRLYTERRLGELLIALALRGGDRRSAHWHDHPTLADRGLSRSTVSRAYTLATMPMDRFRAYIEHQIAQDREPTLRGLLRLAGQLHGETGTAAHQQVMEALREIIARSDQRFPAILVTPCWRRQSPKSRRRQVPASGMTWQEVARIPIPELAAPDAHLYVWVNPPNLPFIASLVGRWGYEVANVYCHRTNLGRYCDWCHDEISLTLVATRGQLPSRGKNHPNWREIVFSSDRPTDDQLQETVERFSPPPYLHIFGVSSRPLWSFVALPSSTPQSRSL